MTEVLGLEDRLRAAGCVFAEEEAALLQAETGDPDRLEELVSRRVAGEPLETVLGWVAFGDLRVLVDRGVFVPRRRSLALVRAAVGAVRGARPVVVDLCCGSGALGVAVAAELGNAALWAVDLDPAAVACARRNVEPLGGQVLLGDLDGPLPADLQGAVDLLLCHAPYVPAAELALMPVEARDHEPTMALVGGDDGLDVVRRVAALAPRWLSRGGTLLVETSRRQSDEAARAFTEAGLDVEVVRDPDLGATVVVGTRPQ